MGSVRQTCSRRLQRVFDCLYTYYTNAAASGGGGWVGGVAVRTKLFRTVQCAKSCDVRVTEKLSTFSCAKPCIYGGATQSRTGLDGFATNFNTQRLAYMRPSNQKRVTCDRTCYKKTTLI
jgi:hypothetical protein